MAFHIPFIYFFFDFCVIEIANREIIVKHVEL